MQNRQPTKYHNLERISLPFRYEFRIEKIFQNVYNNIETFYLLTLFWREYYEKEKDWRLIGAG